MDQDRSPEVPDGGGYLKRSAGPLSDNQARSNTDAVRVGLDHTPMMSPRASEPPTATVDPDLRHRIGVFGPTIGLTREHLVERCRLSHHVMIGVG